MSRSGLGSLVLRYETSVVTFGNVQGAGCRAHSSRLGAWWSCGTPEVGRRHDLTGVAESLNPRRVHRPVIRAELSVRNEPVHAVETRQSTGQAVALPRRNAPRRAGGGWRTTTCCGASVGVWGPDGTYSGEVAVTGLRPGRRDPRPGLPWSQFMPIRGHSGTKRNCRRTQTVQGS